MAIHQSDHKTTPGSHARPDRPEQITLGLTRPMADALDALSHKIGAPVEVVLTQAVALLMVAVEAQKRGQRLCLADDDLNIVGEIVDFGTLREEVGIDPFPQPESDRLDS